MRLFDAHNHLQNYASDAELDAAMRAASAAGVSGMICCGTLPEDWPAVLELAGRYAAVTPAFGLHPWFDAGEGWLEKLEEFIRRTPCCVGEMGLDGVRNLPGQEERFLLQLELAKKFGRPGVIHCVKSWGRMAELLKKAGLPAFILHSYSGSPEMVKGLAALGGYFSFGGGLLDPKREKLRAALAAVPPGRLLLETEAPQPDADGRSAGPAGVAGALGAAADILALPSEELAERTSANAGAFLEYL